MLKWLFLLDIRIISKFGSSSFKKRKFFSGHITLIVENRGHKHNKLFQDILY